MIPLDLCPDKGHPLAFLKRLSSVARGRHLSVGLEPRPSTFMPSSPLRQPVLQAFVSFPHLNKSCCLFCEEHDTKKKGRQWRAQIQQSALKPTRTRGTIHCRTNNALNTETKLDFSLWASGISRPVVCTQTNSRSVERERRANQRLRVTRDPRRHSSNNSHSPSQTAPRGRRQ